MRKKMLFLMISLFVILYPLLTVAENEKPNVEWHDKYHYVYHAHGGIDGLTYTNSKDALELNYGRGGRVFESDMILTSDNVLVARHDWDIELVSLLQQESIYPSNKMGEPITYNEFNSIKIYEKYIPIRFEEIALFMKEHPDMYLITDTKDTQKEEFIRQFKSLVDTAKLIDYSILDRIIPQIYNQRMLEWLDEIYPFKSIIYTLYLSPDTDDQVVEFVKNKRIDVVTMWTWRAKKEFIEKLTKQNVKVFAHTSNNIEAIVKLKSLGVSGIYTDFITVKDMQLKAENLIGDEVGDVYINDIKMNFDFGTKPIIFNGTTFIPMRKLLEAQEIYVDWVSDKNKVIANINNKKIEYTIGEKMVLINGVPVELPYPGFTKEGVTLIPLRFFSESIIGNRVVWNSENASIHVYVSKD